MQKDNKGNKLNFVKYMFNKVDLRKKYSEMEKEVLKFWKENKTFEKSIKQRDEKDAYVFYDGPPFITGVPHYGTLLSSIVKDVVPRYWTMKGKRVERRWGWDCHGLPAENLVEKKLGIKDKRDVKKIGLEKYIETCHKEMVQGGNEWEDTIERIGRWVEFKNAYKTMDKEYMESVWWAFKTLHEKGKIYEGEKVLMYCTRCATPISKAEVAMDNSYKVVTDPSAYVKFKLEEEENTYLLAWTTTPWTLSANVALAVGNDIDYIKLKIKNEELKIEENFILAKDRLEEIFKDREYEIVEELKGKDLVGKRYKPLFDFYLDINEELLKKKRMDNDRTDVVVSVVVDKKENVLLGFREYTKDRPEVGSDFWIAPGGRVEARETVEEAIRRELKEECNIEDYKIKKYLGSSPGYLEKHDLVFYLLEVKDISQIKNNEPEKFKEWKFFSMEQLPIDKFPNKEEDRKFFTEAIKWGNAYKVYAGDFVTTEDGTGIVHIAPAFGEDDYAVAQKESLPVVNTVDENGDYIDGKWKGQNVWEVNKEIAKTLLSEGAVLKIDYIQHEYPHCHRCGTKLMYRAHPSWFMDIDGQRSEMLEQNKNINWFPDHFKDKRFKNTVETAPDWNLSRDRFWATPIPVWRGTKEDGAMVEKVIGSYAELKELSGQELDDYHLPYVDRIEFELDGVKMRRIEKVMDCWFESGSMPFAQFHYPFENKEKFEKNFPGDFISEYVGQIRAWFYYLHAISVGIFGKEAFKNVIVTGTIAGSDGKKMSKSLGNYTDSNILLDQYSSDALRYLLMSSPLLNGEDFALIDKDVSDIQRKLVTLWNSYGFFVMYANVDNWSPEKLNGLPKVSNSLDRWIISKLHQLIKTVDENMMLYDVPSATNPMMDFIDNLSNWYIRRSRKRFWKSENDGDKNEAYQTLYYVLVELSKVMAPFTPFIAEEIYGNLIQSSQSTVHGKESVHLADFPVVDESLIDDKINKDMEEVREIVNIGLQLRAKSAIKVRQPLNELRIKNCELSEELLDIIKEEVNVKHIACSIEHVAGEEGIVWDAEEKVGLNTAITPELKVEGQAREIIRYIQEMRKEAGYEVDNRIKVWHDGVSEVFDRFGDLIARETLADEVLFKEKSLEADLEKELKIDGDRVVIKIKR